jgi:hypothetical protein
VPVPARPTDLSCTTQKADADKFAQWVTVSTPKTLPFNQDKLAATNAALITCLEHLVPIWRGEETEITKLLSQQPDVPMDEFEVKFETNEKVPYFNGSGPLTYTFFAARGRRASPLHPWETFTGVLISRFSDFLNYFVYSDYGSPFRSSGIPLGARTYAMGTFPAEHPNTDLLAEARIVSSKDGRSPFELEEFHYDRHGKLVFHCISKINNLGAKVEEIKSEGRKEREFYFVWPVRLAH